MAGFAMPLKAQALLLVELQQLARLLPWPTEPTSLPQAEHHLQLHLC